ncbi:AAA family ATPase [Pseudofulvimonas gallinarii]|uniref:SpoVK/Ycf46/Vps4 family AAA+-type ATPase n=1 Tax=Pseudofulvimonas gallinarii TaxID=634155 RepID=A0A4S3KWN7_9GAMM|nr:ATP-binding protein [Pseudofulvimonas gallinarii]TCS98466.1 SpoVK/Ycf46/Vps4 family AAA+-type ATPase [Pseudofulvimonas gallinarii]THD13733.1 hypothetical protein B1808_06795 [Pseudofulvimonas gallinarii]
MSSTTSVPEATDCSDSLVKAAQQVAARLLVAETDHRRLARGLLDMPAVDRLVELGLIADGPPDSMDGKARGFRDYVRRLIRRVQPVARAADIRVEPLDRNLDHVARIIGLDDVERRVLRVGALMCLCGLLREVFDNGRCAHNDWERQRQLRGLFGIDAAELGRLFSRRARLYQLGLFDYGDLDMQVSDQFARGLCADNFEPMRLVAHKVRQASAGNLALEDFSHLSDLDRLMRHVRISVERGAAGVNVLVYGPPGTGKTQLVKSIAAELGCQLWEVPSADEDGDVRDGNGRANTYALVQRLLQRDGRSLVMFDEVEDVFGRGHGLLDLFGGHRSARNSKGWINEQLEGNPVPTFWLCNDIGAMDPAHIRRFDEVLELRAPNRAVRARIVARHLPGDLVSEDCRRRITAIENLPPAQVERAGRVVAALADASQAERDQAVLRVLENSLRAMGMMARLPPPVLPGHYDPGVLNADADLEEIVQLLSSGEGARLLLYGPSGTGKTAFAHYLGERLDRPVLVRRLSDLLDMFVGGTERNIAEAFASARNEGAILLIDEADGLLREREGARASWEVTQVNEMLTQMESFDGVFIASTNLVGQLDAASLRRFDFKLRFDGLRRDQREAMFRRLWADLAGGEASATDPDPASLERVAALDGLTPGDFATVRRQLERGRARVSAATIAGRLAAEVALKPGARRHPIGFQPA